MPNGNLSKPCQKFTTVHFPSNLPNQFIQLPFCSLPVQWNIRSRFIHKPQEQIHIGHSERTTASVTSRSRRAPGTFRPHFQPSISPLANGTSSGSHRLDLHCRGQDLNRANLLLIAISRLTRNPGHIGTGPAHIKGQNLLQITSTGQRSSTGNPACRTTQQTIHRTKCLRGFQLPSTCHQRKGNPRQGVLKRT